jgi:hypothetical protein
VYFVDEKIQMSENHAIESDKPQDEIRQDPYSLPPGFQGPAILPSMPVRVSDKILFFFILFCTGNRKCNWYAGTITVNSELDSASNDIYFLNMRCSSNWLSFARLCAFKMF